MTKVLYGKGNKYVDVTDKYRDYVPKTDESRAAIFGIDPLPGVQKEVKIISSTGTEVYPVGQYRLPDRLAELHKKLKLRGGSFTDELEEQVMAALFLDRHHKVLEIGADVGTNTCIISSICDTPPVVVECNNAVESTLRQNLESNGLGINLEMGALTKGRLIFKHSTHYARTGQSTVILEEGQPIPHGYSEIRSISYDYLVQKYHKFDTVVADCEGAFYYIIQDFPEILDDISMLIIENDYKVKGQKDYVDQQLIDKGFIRVYHNILPKAYGFPHCDSFYAVWKKFSTMKVRSSGYKSNYKYSQVGDLIIRDRGLNIVYVDTDGSLKYKNFDTFVKDYTSDIIQFHGDLIKRCNHYYIVVYDEAAHKLNLDLLGSYLENYGIVQIRHLKIRYAYYCSYYKGKVQERLSDIEVMGTVSLGADSRITVCCTPWKYKYFEDYIVSVSDMLNCNILTSDDLYKYKYRDDQLYIFCMHPPSLSISESDKLFDTVSPYIQCKKKMVLNTEQMTAHHYLKYYTKLIKDGMQLMDYSLFNSQVLGQKSRLVPYQYNDYEVSKLKRYISVPKKYDVVMICTVHPRRQNIFDALVREGITVKYAHGWKEVRDEQVGECRLLLNIHATHDKLVWESMRCDRWLFSGMPVVSEICIDSADLDIKDYVHWAAYEQVVDKVKAVLSDIKQGISVTVDIPDSIIDSRKQLLYEFKNSI